MAVEYRFNREKEILYITIIGSFTPEDIEKTAAYITKSNEFSPEVNTVWDIRFANFTNISLDYQEKLKNIRKRFPQRGKAKIALVADNDLSFGLARMYEQLSAELPRKLKVFKKLNEAEKWLLNEF